MVAVRPRVLLADDLPECLEAFALILEGEFEIVGRAPDGQEAVALCKRLMPDVLVLDISMPGITGLEAARQLNAMRTPPRLVFVSAHAGLAYVEGAREAGGSGFVLKARAGRDLATAILLAMEGRQFVSPGVSATL